MARSSHESIRKPVSDLIEGFEFEFFRSLSEPVRLDILKYLLLNGRSDIGTIAKALPQDRSVISRHLTLMQKCGILTGGKEGRHKYYEIDGRNFLRKLETLVERVRRCTTACCP